jgi:uncharacterized protein YeaO (DUF488 family)
MRRSTTCLCSFGCGESSAATAAAGEEIAVLGVTRAYEPAASTDGRRILVDRLWPRGLSKQRVAIDDWMKELAPSTKLRRWFAHDPTRWREFQRRYTRELRAHSDLVDRLAALARRGRVTLVFAARDEQHSDAVVLARVIRRRMLR